MVRRVPEVRIAPRNGQSIRTDGEFVLYWMIACRRPGWNFALERTLEWSRALGKPVLVLEALRCGYPWASARIHRFILEGMADNAGAFRRAGLAYYPYVERAAGEGSGLLEWLAARASVVVTDEFPCFFLPRMVESAGRRLPVLMEQVDSNGLLPLRAAPGTFRTAHSFRRFLQKELPKHIGAFPQRDPLLGLPPGRLLTLPKEAVRRWPPADANEILMPSFLDQLPLDHSVTPAPVRGGFAAAEGRLARFLERNLGRYVQDRNLLEDEATSGLSAHLHFGHVSAHQVFAQVALREAWNPGRLSPRASGSRAGWWGMGASAEAFLDQLTTWRELGFNACAHDPGYGLLESLPSWAQGTLELHANDARAHLYSLAEFEQAQTHDPLWNAAQRQLLRDGRIHNYLRMLWGKKILEWSPSPNRALEVMVELNNKYALDGRDPNSYSGILWVLGKYDRPWGPTRPVYGTVRTMSSENTARKLNVKAYLKEYAS